MGALVAIGAAIVSAVAAVVTTVASIIYAILSAVIAALAYVGTVVYQVFVGLGVGVLEGMGVISMHGATSALVATGVTEGIGLATYYGVSTAIGAVVSYVGYFLEAIHFKTLLQIHEIAYLVSSDYREKINELYNNIAKVSGDLGLGAGFILLALQNARTIVMDVSTMMGRPFDLGEVAYLRSMEQVLKKINENALQYQNNPGSLLWDIDQIMIRPAVDSKSQIMQVIFNTMESLSNISESVVDKINIIKRDVDKFIADLPAEIRNEIQPKFLEATAKLDQFIIENYIPKILILEKMVKVVEDNTSNFNERFSEITDRLLYPGDLFDVLKNKDEAIIFDQGRKVGNVLYQETAKKLLPLESIPSTVNDRLKIISDALQASYSPPEWFIVEGSVPAFLPGKQSTGPLTWYKGDY